MPFMPDEIEDITNTVLATILKKNKWTDLSMPLQFLTVAEFFLKDLAKDPVQSGPTQTWPVQYANTGTARMSELFGQDVTSRTNIMTRGTQQWCLPTGNFIYDVREEIFQQDDVARLCDHLEVLIHSARTTGLILFENQMWTAPASSSQRPRNLSGIPHWVIKNSAPGFNGGDPSGFSDGAGGLPVSLVPNAQNWTGTYSEVTNDGLFDQMRRACQMTYFKAPDPYKSATPMKQDWVFYTDGETRLEVQKELMNLNDNIGTDVGKYKGLGTFSGVPFDWVPIFTEDSTSSAYDTSRPVYGLNMNSFLFQFQTGKALHFGKPHLAQNYEHNVLQRDWDASCNMLCMDRRTNFVFYKA
jgi:hypothetical protein